MTKDKAKARMDNRDYPKVRKAARKQGWRVEATTEGEMLYAPDGQSKIVWHTAHASSDPHALDSLVREMRKSGFRWPPMRRR